MTFVVGFMKRTFLNTDKPIITLASPITTIPIPMLWLAFPLDVAIRAPDIAENPFPIASPIILEVPGFFANMVTNWVLFPVALKSKPFLVCKYQSSTSFIIIAITTTHYNPPTILYLKNTKINIINVSKTISQPKVDKIQPHSYLKK